MGSLLPPHGGKLTPRLLKGAQHQQALRHAEGLPQIPISSKAASDLVMMASGAFSPLRGFMGQADYQSVVEEMHLASGEMWPIPITLAVASNEASDLSLGDEIALRSRETGDLLAIMLLEEIFTADLRQEALRVFGTEDPNHPGVNALMAQGNTLLGGAVRVLSEGGYPERFPEYARPEETRAVFEARGWSSVAAFQTRNPMHRSHEYLAKIALEICDGLLIHPIVGQLKEGDIPADVRMRCYRVLLDKYFPRDRAVLRVYPMEMRYAGPREALLHAIIRQNFGCSHLIVGRDHAGVGDYYGAFDAQNIFDTLPPGDLLIQPLKLDWTFWCSGCGGMASMKTCPHDPADRLLISGTKLRMMLSSGRTPPEQYSRPEVIEILLSYYASRTEGEST